MPKKLTSKQIVEAGLKQLFAQSKTQFMKKLSKKRIKQLGRPFHFCPTYHIDNECTCD